MGTTIFSWWLTEWLITNWWSISRRIAKSCNRQPWLVGGAITILKNDGVRQWVSDDIPYIWVNYNNSLTWIKAIWGWFLLLTMIPVRSQWGRYNLPRYMKWKEKKNMFQSTNQMNVVMCILKRPCCFFRCFFSIRWMLSIRVSKVEPLNTAKKNV